MRPPRLVAFWSVLAVLSVVAFLALTAGAGLLREPEKERLDSRVREMVLANRTPVGDRVMSVVTHAGSSRVLLPLTLLAAALLWRGGRRRISAVVIAGPAIAASSYALLKPALQRPRPHGAAAAGLATYAFPSGHATVSTAVAVTLCYVLARERVLPPVAALALGLFVPLLVGFSRVYLDVHWATDVFAGWALGLAFAAGGALSYELVAAGTPS